MKTTTQPKPNAQGGNTREPPGLGNTPMWIVWILSLALVSFYLSLYSLRFPWGGSEVFAARSVSTAIAVTGLFSVIYAISVSRNRRNHSDSSQLLLLAIPFAIAIGLALVALTAVYKWEIHRMWHHKLERLSIFFYLSALAFAISTILMRRTERQTATGNTGDTMPFLMGSLYLAACLIGGIVLNNCVLIYVEMHWSNERNVFLVCSLVSCLVLAAAGIFHVRRRAVQAGVACFTAAEWFDIMVAYVLATLALTGLGVGILECMREPNVSVVTVAYRDQYGGLLGSKGGASIVPIGVRVWRTILYETKVVPFGLALCLFAGLALCFLQQRRVKVAVLGTAGVVLGFMLLFYASYHSYPAVKNTTEGVVDTPKEDPGLTRQGVTVTRCAPTFADRVLVMFGMRSKDVLHKELSRYAAEQFVKSRLPAGWSLCGGHGPVSRSFSPLRTGLRDVPYKRKNAADSVDVLSNGVTAVYYVQAESAGGPDAKNSQYIVAVREESPFVWKCEQIVLRSDQLQGVEK